MSLKESLEKIKAKISEIRGAQGEKKSDEAKKDSFEEFFHSTVNKEQIQDELKKIQQTHTFAKLSDSEDVVDAVSSREFKQFKTEEEDLKRIKTLFERSCKKAGSLVKIKADQKNTLEIEEDLEYLWLNVTPDETASLGFLLMIGFFVITAILVVTQILCLPLALFFAGLGLAAMVMVPKYPSQLAARKRMRSIGEMPMVLLYLVMYLRNTPVVEGAVRFAAIHLEGPIAMDFRKLMWDVETRKYINIEEALMRYTHLWMKWNKEFAESLRLVQSSSNEGDAVRRTAMLDQAVDMMLSGTAERMKHYAQGLRMPVTIIHTMGIILPVMGLVMFPMIVMFMSDMVSSSSLFFAYDVMLFITVYFFANQIMAGRPDTYSSVGEDFETPDIAPPGYYRLAIGKTKVDVPVLLPSLAIGGIVASPGLLYLLNPAPPDQFKFTYLLLTLSIVWGVTLSVYIYGKYTTMQKMGLRKDIVALENEFAEVLFQLGNRLMSGIPIEVALARSKEGIKGDKTTEFIERIERNMTNLGFTFSKALFDPEYGALKYYPSPLIHSTMKVLVESSKKGTRLVASSMLAISKYLKNMHKIEEDINDMLGETASSMQFQGLFLAPAISGVVVGLGTMIMQIMIGVHSKITDVSSTDIPGMGADLGLLSGGGFLAIPSTPPEIFQLIVGLYMLEAGFILSVTSTQISHGNDKLLKYSALGNAVLIATIIYSLAVLISSSMFTSVSGVLV